MLLFAMPLVIIVRWLHKVEGVGDAQWIVTLGKHGSDEGSAFSSDDCKLLLTSSNYEAMIDTSLAKMICEEEIALSALALRNSA
jgi:hypothetical protein